MTPRHQHQHRLRPVVAASRWPNDAHEPGCAPHAVIALSRPSDLAGDQQVRDEVRIGNPKVARCRVTDLPALHGSCG